MQYPIFPKCDCEMMRDGCSCELAALKDPFLYLPPPVPFSSSMQTLAERYRAFDIDWRHYPAFQAAAFLQPKTPIQHSERKKRFQELKSQIEKEGFLLPDVVERLFLNDDYIDRIHHNTVWPSLPERVDRYPADQRFAMFLFMVEGQGCYHWHLMLGPDGSHIVVNANERFGCVRGYPPGCNPDFSKLEVYRCMDSVNHFLCHFFKDSAQQDIHYVERLGAYFDQNRD